MATTNQKGGRGKTTTAVNLSAAQRIKNKLSMPKLRVNTTRQKAMVTLMPIPFIVLILVLIQGFSTPSRKTTRPRAPRPVNAVGRSKNKINWQIPAPYPTTLRDPMQLGSVATAQAGTGKLIVKGIVHSKNKPSAIIAAQIVYEGDKVLGATIVKINEDNVELEMNGKRWMQKVQR